MVVKIPELPGKKKYQGLYCIAALPPEDEKKAEFRYKIGMSTNLLKRLQSYHICYPYGYYIYGLLLTKGKTQRQVLDIEKQFFRNIIEENKNYYLPTKEISGAKEYFKLPISVLKRLLNELAEETKSQAITDFKEIGFVENADIETQEIPESEFTKYTSEIDKKVEVKKKNDKKKNEDLKNTTYALRSKNSLPMTEKEKLKKRAQEIKKQLSELEQAQIDVDIKSIRKKATTLGSRVRK
jgi:hypothetical protein